MSSLKALREISSRRELAAVLGYQPKALTYLLFKMPKDQLYRSFTVPKRSGGQRTINAPCPELKVLQRKLADLLSDCLSEITASKKLPKISHGFHKGSSILDNASIHRRRRFVFNVDLENFFGTIHLGRVRGFFINNNDFKFSPEVATTIAQIACFEGVLPQGSPASPVISNLIGHVLDVRLVGLAKKHGCSYSRYADDLTFSTNRPVFPFQIASLVDALEHIWIPGDDLCQEIARCGFKINHSKTRLDYNDSRQLVTGVVVNRKLNVPSEYKRCARAMADRLFKFGSFEKMQFVELNGVKTFAKAKGNINQLSGVFSYIYMVSHWRLRDAAIKPESNLSSIEGVHRDFLFYRDFYANELPTILCEGKTDNVYLKCALKRRSRFFPELILRKKDGSLDYKIKLFKYSRISSRLLGLTGGTPQLKEFIVEYASWCSRFKARGGVMPVIIVIDNDSGANQIYSWLGGVKKTAKPDGMQPYYYVGQNLYIVPTPKATPADMSKIEDFFKADALGVTLGGKSFNPNNDTDTATQYGKHYFAEHVVKVRQDALDFSGFDPFFKIISGIIKMHTAATTAVVPATV